MRLAKFYGRASTYLLAIFGLCLSLSAQERFSDINGTVKDATGAVMPGVKVTVQNVVSKRAYELQTNSDGTYLGLNLEPARYDVLFSRQGFGTKNLAQPAVPVASDVWRLGSVSKVCCVGVWVLFCSSGIAN